MEREPADGRRRGEKRVARDGDIDFKKGDEGEKGSRGEKREGLILESANGMAPFFFFTRRHTADKCCNRRSFLVTIFQLFSLFAFLI